MWWAKVGSLTKCRTNNTDKWEIWRTRTVLSTVLDDVTEKPHCHTIETRIHLTTSSAPDHSSSGAAGSLWFRIPLRDSAYLAPPVVLSASWQEPRRRRRRRRNLMACFLPFRRAHHRSSRLPLNAIYRPLHGLSGNLPFLFYPLI